MPSRQRQSDAEIMGDWNNLKGSEYHIVYALWLLLRNAAHQVAFYQGNDLLVRLARGGISDDREDRSLPIVAMRVMDADSDTWIQLKATSSLWTPSMLLKENLLKNFIHNALQSIECGRGWEARLITQGGVKKKDLCDFVSSPEKNSRLNKRLNLILDEVRQELANEASADGVNRTVDLRALSLTTLKQLSETRSIRIETLKAEIETELAYAYPDRAAVRRICQSLLGAMLTDASQGPEEAKTYDRQWLNTAVGIPLCDRGRLDDDPAAACVEARRRVEPRNWDPEQYARRVNLESAFRRFILASEPLFVLLGNGGSGKSWALTQWGHDLMPGRLCLLIPGDDLDHCRTLPTLVSGRLQSQTTAAWTPDQLLKRVRAASVARGTTLPFVVIIDDLKIPAEGVEVFRRDLARLVEECKDNGIKLIISCHTQLWSLHKLWREIRADDIFSTGVKDTPVHYQKKRKNENSDPPLDAQYRFQEKAGDSIVALNPSLGGGSITYSYVLGDFTRDEMEEALCRRLGEQKGKRAALRIQASGMTALSNPYLLARYLEQHSSELVRENDTLPSITIDGLLDESIRNSLERVATSSEIQIEEIQPAFDALLKEMWEVRPNGLRRARINELFTPFLQGQSEQTLKALQSEGALSIGVEVRLADQRLSERLFARLLRDQSRHLPVSAGIGDLKLETDAGVVIALLRGEVENPVELAETLLQHNAGWNISVVEGLSQCDPNDYRVIAYLLALSRTDRVIEDDAYAAIGKLISRGQRARKLATEQYLAKNSSKHDGARLLAAALEYMPDKVEAVIRLRLSGIREIKGVFGSDRDKKRERILGGALDPLRSLNTSAAANSARRIFGRCSRLIAENNNSRNDYPFVEDVDFVRGRIALYGEPKDIEELRFELSSPDALTRYRSACAMLPIAKERPEMISDDLCGAIRKEVDGSVMNRLLLAAYHLVQTRADELLEAVSDSTLLRKNARCPCAGTLLMLLGNLAETRPQRAAELLPTAPLTLYPGDERAVLTDILVYAYWMCVRSGDEARVSLLILSEPELNDIPENFHPFALRGSALAQLALMFDERELFAEIVRSPVYYRHWGRRFPFIEISEFVRGHAAEICAGERYERFEDLLLRCLREEERVVVDPLNQPLVQSRYACAHASLGLLLEIAATMADPLPLLKSLPQDWQVVSAARALIARGITDRKIVDFAREVSVHRGGTTSFNAEHEREQLRAHLATLEVEPRSALEKERQHSYHPFFQKPGLFHTFVLLTEKYPERILELLDDSIRSSDDLPILYHLESATASWQLLLIATVYRRMFDSKPISVTEGRELCECMLLAARSFPPSALNGEYTRLYEAIASSLDGRMSSNAPVVTPDSLIRHSHSLAASLLERGLSVSDSVSSANITDMLYDRRGWFDTDKYELKEYGLETGFDRYLIYVFPSVRLAMLAVGLEMQKTDIAAEFMRGRLEVHEALKKFWPLLVHPEHYAQSDFITGLDEIEKLAGKSSYDERPSYYRGWILLYLRRLKEAILACKVCIESPSCSKDLKAGTYYNLACAYALDGSKDECRQALLTSHHLKKLNREHLGKDLDLENVRNEGWFNDLLHLDQ